MNWKINLSPFLLVHLVRKAAHYCQPIGDDRFRQQIETKYGITLGQMQRGRPRKENHELPKD